MEQLTSKGKKESESDFGINFLFYSEFQGTYCIDPIFQKKVHYLACQKKLEKIGKVFMLQFFYAKASNKS